MNIVWLMLFCSTGLVLLSIPPKKPCNHVSAWVISVQAVFNAVRPRHRAGVFARQSLWPSSQRFGEQNEKFTNDVEVTPTNPVAPVNAVAPRTCDSQYETFRVTFAKYNIGTCRITKLPTFWLGLRQMPLGTSSANWAQVNLFAWSLEIRSPSEALVRLYHPSNPHLVTAATAAR